MEQHIPTLISDLALILAVGSIVTLLSRRFKQPVVLGYIIAGFLIGPHLNLLDIMTVSDEENIKTLAEIGVIFLLFGLGIEFSFKKLMRVGGQASATALVEILLIAFAGYFTGQLLGWSNMDCLFFGGMLASSSTTIIIRAFDELGIKNMLYSRIVFGVLVVEDILVILLMVMLSTVAVAQHFEGTELLLTVVKLSSFIILWFVLGIYLIPTLLKRAKKWMDDEAYLVLAIGLCFSMVIIAVKVGFSAELGAFIMGSILAETVSAEKIEHITKPVKDLFGAIFFVSIGIMIDPLAIKEYGWIVLAVTMLVIVGKIVTTTFGAVLSGQPLKQSIQVGMSMAQIGEFAFIVATLGMNLGVISEFLFPVAVGVSAITTFTTPYFIKYSENIYHVVERYMPVRWFEAIKRYSESAQTAKAEVEWHKFARPSCVTFFTNIVIVIALMLLFGNFLPPLLAKVIDNDLQVKFITLFLCLLSSSIPIWAAMFKIPGNVDYKELFYYHDYKKLYKAMGAARLVITLSIVGTFAYFLFYTLMSIAVVVGVLFVILALSFRQMQRLYDRMENRFIINYRERETGNNIIKKSFIPHAKHSSWNISLIDLEILQDVEYVGREIGELSWRKDFGVNIVYIKRGENLIYAPGKKDKLLSFDHIGVIATDEQIEIFLPVFNKKIETPHALSNVEDIVVQKFLINEGSPMKGVEIRHSGIRERTDGLVVGIERGDEHFLNPSPDTVFEINDMVWIVGLEDKLQNWDSVPKSVNE